MTDLSTVPLFLVCQQARKHVTVCLSGEGGGRELRRLRPVQGQPPQPPTTACFPRAAPAPDRRPDRAALPDQPQKKGAVNMLKRFVEGAHLPADGGHLRWQYFRNPAQDRLLFSPAFQRPRRRSTPSARCASTARAATPRTA